MKPKGPKMFKKADVVTWAWGQGQAEGEVADVFTKRVTRRIKGKDITRNASAEEPACLVRQKDGDLALKSASELSRR
jgi:hypothetical protein